MTKAKAKETMQHPRVTTSEDHGVRFLHLGTEWVQGAMRLRKPDAIELEYVQQMMMWMLFSEAPRHIVQLGLGSAALTKFCYRRFTDARVTAIELNPAVIEICRAQFALPPNDARLQVLEQDALAFVMDPANHGSVDILQVDLYDAAARGPVFDSPEFYQACADCLTADGMATINLFGDHPSYNKNLQAMQPAFDALTCLSSLEGEENIVVIGFKKAPVIDFAELNKRAAAIRRATDLPARTWVNGMKDWMRGD
jgi:spermidine synthase